MEVVDRTDLVGIRGYRFYFDESIYKTTNTVFFDLMYISTNVQYEKEVFVDLLTSYCRLNFYISLERYYIFFIYQEELSCRILSVYFNDTVYRNDYIFVDMSINYDEYAKATSYFSATDVAKSILFNIEKVTKLLKG